MSNLTPPENVKTLSAAQEKLLARLFNAAMLLIIAGADWLYHAAACIYTPFNYRRTKLTV